MVIVLKPHIEGKYIREQIFAGPDRAHVQLAGAVLMSIGEWQLFGVALLMGAERMQGHLDVFCDYPGAMTSGDFVRSLAEAGVE